MAAVARDPRARFVAGGTTLVDLLRLDVETPVRWSTSTPCRSPRSNLPGGGAPIGGPGAQ